MHSSVVLSSKTESTLIGIAERIIDGTSRDHPADGLLRRTLRSHRGLSPIDADRITSAVFAYFRWLGWLNRMQMRAEQIARALELSERFAHQPQSFPDADLVARAVPGWLQKEMEVTAEFARALQAEPKLWLRARAGQGSILAKKLGHCRVFGSGPLADTLEYTGKEDLFQNSAFHAGEFEIQDLSSQVVGMVCGAQPGQTWWDACAGDGGKLVHLSGLMQNRGLIWASDRSGWRLAKLKRRAARAGVFNYRAVPWDGGPRLPTKTRFDGVLVDAPCSGVGTWQRNPHARWTTTPEDVRELAAVQHQLLAHASTAVKPGGRLVYAICSLTRAESTGVAEGFGKAFPEFKALPFHNPLQPDSAPVAQLALLPQQFGGNGMFIAVWER